MPHQKKTAHVAEKVEHRLAGLKAIDPNLDLGEGCNVMVIQDPIDQLRDRVNAYNDALAVIDSSQIDIKNLEKQLKQLNQKALLGVAFKYGKDSDQYRLAGGTPTSEAARKGTATRLKAKTQEDVNQQN
jgi:hypothetical protein